MSITEARASLADVVDRVRVDREPVYLTRRATPIAVMIDLPRYEALVKAERTVAEWSNQEPSQIEAREAERLRRMAAMEKSAAPFTAWVRPGITHPQSASDLYAARTVDP